MGEGQAGQGLGGSPSGVVIRKNSKAQLKSTYGCIEICSKDIQTYE